MKILFISSGRNNEVGIVVKNQGESIKKQGIELDYFLIKPGFIQYLTAIPKLKKRFRNGGYEIAHAHYSLSAFTAAFSGCKPLVVSLMGSDVFQSFVFRLLIFVFNNYGWDRTIVKTSEMRSCLKLKNADIIPNGVDINTFKPYTKAEARSFLNYSQDKQIILFISNPGRPEKNLTLAEQAVYTLNNDKIEFRHIFNIANEKMPYYYCAADVMLLTSKWEGSVNVVKEAMACNCPIVSTDVGDVRFVIGKTEGCYLTSFDPRDIAEKIKYALDFNKRTNGRKRIMDLSLDSVSISKRIIETYNRVVVRGNGDNNK